MLKKATNVIYLYSEVMPYAICVMRELVAEFGVRVDCIYWDQNKRTPFVPADMEGVYFHKRSTFNETSIISFIREKGPSVMYISGRMDKLYLHAALQFRATCKIVSGSDNQWEGTMKHKLAAMMGQQLYGKYFEYFWVPGPRQYEFARRIGYAPEKIISKCLTADTAVFGKVHQQNLASKQAKYPHTLVYAGRFAAAKGLDQLVAAFNEVKKEIKNDWKLLLIGNGDLPLSANEHTEIRGFMQADELAAECRNWGAFCLPSRREPYGVVIHEFTMAGLPIICSDSVGAADGLVINNYNGFVYRSGDKEHLKQALKNLMGSTDASLVQMGVRGNQLSQVQSPVIAAYSLMSVL